MEMNLEVLPRAGSLDSCEEAGKKKGHPKQGISKQSHINASPSVFSFLKETNLYNESPNLVTRSNSTVN